MPATIRYNTFRLLMVLVVGAVCYVLGARGLLLIMLAFFISLPLSFVLLARWRRAMIDEFASGKARELKPVRVVGDQAHKLNPVRAVSDRIDAANQAEDEALDQAETGPADEAGPR